MDATTQHAALLTTRTMSSSRAKQLETIHAVSESVLEKLAELGITPPPRQRRQARDLSLTPPDLPPSHVELLSPIVAEELRTILRNRFSELEQTTCSAYKDVVNEWRGPEPPDAFESIALCFEKMCMDRARQLVAGIDLALQRHWQDLTCSSQAGTQARDNRFRTDVKKVLEEYFERKSCPTPAEKRLIAETTNLTVKQVTTWFANQRSRKGKVIRKLNRKNDRIFNDFSTITPIFEEPEPICWPDPPAQQLSDQIEGAVDLGRASPVPSLSSSVSSDQSSKVNSSFEMPSVTEPPQPAEVPSEAQQLKSTSPAPTMITPAEWNEIFPDVLPVETFNPIDSLSSDSSSFFPPTQENVKNPFTFAASENDLNMVETPGVDYWENLLHTLSEEGETPKDLLDEKDTLPPHSSSDPESLLEDWTKWSQWSLPVLEGFDDQNETERE